MRGDGTDEDTLRRAGAEDADIFIAMTEGDNRNVMAAQLAHEALGAKRVIAKINDPVRAEAYADLGIATLCRTDLMADAVNAFLGLRSAAGAASWRPTGSHHGGEDHHDPSRTASATAGATSSAPRRARRRIERGRPDDVRSRRRRRQGRLLPDQGAHRVRP